MIDIEDSHQAVPEGTHETLTRALMRHHARPWRIETTLWNTILDAEHNIVIGFSRLQVAEFIIGLTIKYDEQDRLAEAEGEANGSLTISRLDKAVDVAIDAVWPPLPGEVDRPS